MGDYFKFNENVSSKEVGAREIGQVIETLTSLELMETPVLYDPNNPDPARPLFQKAKRLNGKSTKLKTGGIDGHKYLPTKTPHLSKKEPVCSTF